MSGSGNGSPRSMSPRRPGWCAPGCRTRTVPAGASTHVWTVKAMKKAVIELGDHLRGLQIQIVTLESNQRLLAGLVRDPGSCRARRCSWSTPVPVKNAPGRAKTDKKDAVWLAKLTEQGLLQPSFVPPQEIRRLRALTRLRTDLVPSKTRYWARLEKLLERALDQDLRGAVHRGHRTGRAMIGALIAGQRDPKALADLAIGDARAKRAERAAAWTPVGKTTTACQARIPAGPPSVDLNRQIDQLTAQVCERIEPDSRRLGRGRRRTTGPGRRRPARTPRAAPPSRSWTPSPAAASSPPWPSSPRSAWT